MEFQKLTEKDWLKLHRDPGVVTASQVATIMGENPYESAYTLYQRKIGAIPDIDENIPMRVGHALENLVGEFFTETTGYDLCDPGDYSVLQSAEMPCLRVTLDRHTINSTPVELKAPGSRQRKHWVDGETGNVPFRIQLQAQIEVCEVDSGYLAAIVGQSEFFYFEHTRNDAFIKKMFEDIIEFRDRCLNQDAPEMDASGNTLDTMLKLHPKDNGETVERPDLGPVVGDWVAAKVIEKDAEATVAEYGNILKTAFGENSFLVCDGYKLSFKHQHRKGHTVKESDSRVLRLTK